MNATQRLALKFLEEGPATVTELKDHLNCSREYARRIMHSLPVRIKRWSVCRSNISAVYELGSGPDAPRPDIQSYEGRIKRARESMRELRERRRVDGARNWLD